MVFSGSREVKDTASQTEDLLGSEGQPVLDTASQTEDLPGGENRALLERTSQQREETEGGKLKAINSILMFKYR